MSNLRLPISNRRDLMIYSFPIDCADSAAKTVIHNLSERATSPLRVVPLEDRAAYAEALASTMESASRQPRVGAAWLVSADDATFGMRVRQDDGADEEVVHAIRIIQLMAN